MLIGTRNCAQAMMKTGCKSVEQLRQCCARRLISSPSFLGRTPTRRGHDDRQSVPDLERVQPNEHDQMAAKSDGELEGRSRALHFGRSLPPELRDRFIRPLVTLKLWGRSWGRSRGLSWG